ncbi:hypothetical protein PybrP1_011478 [[Pythium] brassicae (nom. inval.)]|nr:hypothetical protein PybrP1_011478 [[Pythium] brassicae (nom. inval.)]
MSDVAQILGLAAPGASAAATAAAATASELEKLKPAATSASASAQKGAKQKKPSGMRREVLELLESTHRASHALLPGLNTLSLQQKWRQRRAIPAVKWQRKPFRNPARAGLAGESEAAGLTLSHWMKAHAEPTDYVFARFNIACDVTRYSAEEYEHAVAPHKDPNAVWTREETDALLALCARYDLRWVVVADRYNASPAAKTTTPRSVEDLKYRYYEVTRLLGEYRDRVAGQQEQHAAAVAVKLEASGESSAVQTADATPERAAEAAAEPVKPAAAAAPALLPPASDRFYVFNVAYEKQRKRQLELAFTRSLDDENEIKRLAEELRAVEQQLKKAAVKVDTKKKKELADVPFTIARELPTGVLLRSALLALPQHKHALSSKLVKKMELMLDELGVPVRPMPTKDTCELFDTLRKDVVGLLSLRKHLAAKQSEAQVLKDRFKSLTGTDFQPVTTPVRRADRGGDALPASGASALASGNAAGGASATPGSQGKALKHAEKAFRVSNKRRGAGSGTPGVPAKRNKKVL